MQKKILLITPERCTGCNICGVVCALRNEKVLNPLYSRVHIVFREDVGLYLPVICQQCEDPMCKRVCPVKAIELDPNSDALVINYDRCIGCRACMFHCPFGGISWSKDRKVVKCDLCRGEPACAKVCTREVILYVDATKAHLRKRVEAAMKYQELVRKLLGVPP